ncbi:uncharacterized protein [Phaseolus vulgaris]|uniref:uncharacterized protein isoform X2 n=1 Tax=Phaseolus vulgaris TaxID=3885 RepID=UPI0035CB7483
MTSSLVKIQGEQVLTNDFQDLSIKDLSEAVIHKVGNGTHGGICAICLDEILLQETALVKGCEHAYCIQDYMFEESVCLLLRASWFKPLSVEEHVVHEDAYEELEEYYPYEDEEMEEAYYGGSSSVRIGNRRWGDNGYVRGGRQEARPVHRSNFQDSGASSSREPKKKDAGKGSTGRRAKRTQKREAADKAAEAKHSSFR